jgi:hypothetical protein
MATTKILGSEITALSASYATTAQTLLGSVTSASFASTASSVNILKQSVTISGSVLVNTTNQTLGQFVGTQNGYAEFSVRNTSNGASASGDFAVYADTGTTLNNYIDMGINNSGLNPAYFYGGTDFGNALDAYVYNVGGDLRIGNATSQAPYSQSFHLFSNPTATPNITITGSRVGINKTGSLNATLDVTGSMVITGSLRGQVSALSIASNTASVDMSTNNFFTLNLVNGVTTNINPTNIQPGQTVNIRINQGSDGTGKVSFPSFVDQASGSLYTGSAVSNAIDIVTMITFDSSLVFLSSIRNMI